MKHNIPVYTIKLNDYNLNLVPHYKKLGKIIDNQINEHFNGRRVALRALSVADHEEMTVDGLSNMIINTGTDRYNLKKKSFWHTFEAYKGKHIDLFATDKLVSDTLLYGEEIIELFFEGAKVDRGYSIKLDLISVYDPDKLEEVPIKHEDGGIEIAWKFKDEDNKTEALIGIFKLV